MSTAALPVHVALVDDTKQLNPADLQALAGAMSEQILHDFVPQWKVSASVAAYSKAPPSCWAVHIKAQLDQPGALGYHTDLHNQPVAYVELTNDYTVTVSHEVLEMLADPWGQRLHAARPPQDVQQFAMVKRVHYLLEVCDPPEAKSYEVGGIALSDFVHPQWYRSYPAPALAYSQAGGCVKPRQVANGGYVSFVDDNGNWWQVFNENNTYQVRDLGVYAKSQFSALREWTDHCACQYKAVRGGTA